MAAINWHQSGDRVYEAGLDRGVLYVDGQDGVAWNGLISVDENYNNEVEAIYYDAVKANDIVTLGDFSGTLRAYTYPDEFLECEGIFEDQSGVFVTNQPVKRFGLCYRTLVGEGTNSLSSGYKLHILYNLTAVPAQRTRRSLALDISPIEFQWELSSIPEPIAGYRPTSHLILDSRRIDEWLLQDIESILYGDETRGPTLPDLRSLTTFIRKWDRLIIQDNGDGTWTAIAPRPGIITQISDTEYEIESDTIVYLDDVTYEISSSEKNEEDI